MSTPTYTERVAASVRAEMARKQITQTQVAESLGLAQSAVSRRLNGHTEFTGDELGRVAELLGVPVAVLFGERVA